MKEVSVFVDILQKNGVNVTQVTEHADSTTVQFEVIDDPIEDIYYKSVVDFSDEGFISRYEIRLPHRSQDAYTIDDVKYEYKDLLAYAETEAVSDWQVNISRTNDIFAAHVESVFSGKKDAPTSRQLAQYVLRIQEATTG